MEAICKQALTDCAIITFTTAVYIAYARTYTGSIHKSVWETIQFKGNISIFENTS